MNADKGSPDALLVAPRTPSQDRPRQDVSPVRPSRRNASKIVGVLAAVVVVSLVALGMWALSRPTMTPETVPAPQTTQHDSGITQALRERDRAVETQHDSGITQALRERDEAVEVHHDSGIAQALREREQAVQSPTTP